MACVECVATFFSNPINMVLTVGPLLVSAILLLVFKLSKGLSFKKKLGLIYAHIFTLVFPFVFYLLFKGCEQVMSSCSQADKTISLLLITGGISLAIGLSVTPLLFIRRHMRNAVRDRNVNLNSCIKKYSAILGIKAPSIYLINDAKPLAFSVKYFKASVFLSIGLVELLSRKEVEAVLLHELAHIKNRSSMLKWSINLLKLVSPLARFTTFHHELTKEELKADSFAIQTQRSDKFIISAKSKINQFYQYQ